MPIIYDGLREHIILDPFLLYGLIYICPKKELPGLFTKVHPFFSMSFLSKLLKDSKETNQNEVIIIIGKASNIILSATSSYVCIATFFGV